jgi:acyl-coenzyme A thioesterase PaaI-like protein
MASQPPVELFTRDLGFRWWPDDDSYVGAGTIRSEVCIPGTTVVSAAFIATCADILSGVLCTQGMLPHIGVTVDLRVTLVNAPAFGAFSGRSLMVKRGRAISVGRVEFRDANDQLFGISHAAFHPSADALDAPLADLRPDDIREAVTDVRTLIGCRSARAWTAEADFTPRTRNPSGTMQGGVHAFLAEAAATGLGEVVHDLEVRYLRPIIGGPGRAQVVSSVTGRTQQIHRVEIVDAASSQLAAIAMVNTVPSAALHQ